MTNEETINELEEKLETLKKESSEKERIKQLQKNIQSHKILQSKTGKFFNKLGAFGEELIKLTRRKK